MQNTNANQKKNLKLYALAYMQTNNQNEKHEATFPLCLNKALLCKGKKVRDRKGKQNITISPGYMQSAPKLCGLLITGAHGASATPSQCQDLAHESRGR